MLELLSCIEGLVYHARAGHEHAGLRERIDAALRDDEDRLEADMVRRSLADMHWEEATLAANKRTLLELLRLRWGPLPAETEQVIETTQDAEQLAAWLRGVVTAEDLEGVGIVPPA
jgi:hypothetical protein